MKKVIFGFAAFAALTAFSSCKTCVNCRPTGGGVEEKVCKSDYNNNQTLYDAAVLSYKSAGYTCD